MEQQADYQATIRQQWRGQVAEGSGQRLCIFCHYDADGMIADYVRHYVRALQQAGCEVWFVSNAPTLKEEHVEAVLPHVRTLLWRENKGYDFGAYYTGLMAAGMMQEGAWDRYQQVMMANDSVYGPFYPLQDVFQRMEQRSYDVWGVTDGISYRYYVQSYFMVWENRPAVMQAARDFFRRFTFTDDKDEVIARYELGLSQFFLQQGLKIGAMCGQEEMLSRQFEWLQQDACYAHLDASVRQHEQARRAVLGWQFLWRRRQKQHKWRILREYWQSAIAIPQYHFWYPLVKYMQCPFIKVALLKDPKLILAHQAMYLAVLKQQYPNYDVDDMQQHLHRVRQMQLPKGVF